MIRHHNVDTCATLRMRIRQQWAEGPREAPPASTPRAQANGEPATETPATTPQTAPAPKKHFFLDWLID
jgi:hypothetical protein